MNDRTLFSTESANIDKVGKEGRYSSSTFNAGLSRGWSCSGGTLLAPSVRIGKHFLCRGRICTHIPSQSPLLQCSGDYSHQARVSEVAEQGRQLKGGEQLRKRLFRGM